VKKKASAVWHGTLKEGTGTITVPSGVLKGATYTWAQRFADVEGTNPEELVAASHAACFAMAFSGKLTTAGFPPENIDATATVSLEKTDAGMTITEVHLTTHAKVPGNLQGSLRRTGRSGPRDVSHLAPVEREDHIGCAPQVNRSEVRAQSSEETLMHRMLGIHVAGSCLDRQRAGALHRIGRTAAGVARPATVFA
jgi:osmotically inducible protein OsmC